MITIVPYESGYHSAFRSLNLEWLEKYNLVESHDLEILDDPEGIIIDRGGCIFMALDGDKVVGTAGLYKENEQEYELVKMAVDPANRGQGISKLLIETCLNAAKKFQAKKVFLYSNSQLTTALKLYQQYKFQHVPATNAPFLTADVKMELSLDPNQ